MSVFILLIGEIFIDFVIQNNIFIGVLALIPDVDMVLGKTLVCCNDRHLKF